MSQKISKTIIVAMSFGELEPTAMITITHTYASPAELLEHIRAYVCEWGQTDEGQQAKGEACDDFNWGDFAEWGAILREKIPGLLEVTWFYPDTNGCLTAAVVDHDERLMSTGPQAEMLASRNA